MGRDETTDLVPTLARRFLEHPPRHPGILWAEVKARLEANPDKLWSLHQMELTGGEPDVIGMDEKTGEFLFVDCSPESPAGRRSVCYDREGLESRKSAAPERNCMDMAAKMKIEVLTPDQYQQLQTIGEFDLKTSSWLASPPDIRALGGALFGDRRYGKVFIYHNGAQSYYAARGFRGVLRV